MTITLQMDDTSLDTYRNWAEISEDSAEDYGVTDEDSSPDDEVRNDDFINHNDPTADSIAGDEDDNDYEDVSPIQPVPVYDLALIKVLASGQTDEVEAGEQVDYNIIVTNQGTVASNNYSVMDVLPAGMSFIEASDSPSATAEGVFWYDLPNLDPGQTKVLNITLQLDDPTLGESYSNFAEIIEDSADDYEVTDEDSTPDEDPDNDPVVDHNDTTADTVDGDEDDSDTETITPIVPAPIYDLALIKTLAPDQSTSIMEGDEVNYNITITNQGTVPSNDYTVLDQIPAGMSYVSASDGATNSGQLVTWSNLPNIDPGQTKVLTITLLLDDASLGNYRNIAEITEDSAEDYGVSDEDSTTDSDLTNDLVINHNDADADEIVGDEDDNDFEEIAAIQPTFLYDLALVKLLADGQESVVLEGETVTYDIFISNQGTTPSGNYSVMDVIPEGMGFVNASNNGSEDGNTVSWTDLPSIDPGQTEILSITLVLDDASIGSYRNYAEITDDSSEEFGVSDEDSTPDTDSSNDLVINHNNINEDDMAGDEDDSDFEDITSMQPVPVYDLALIKTIADGQNTTLSIGDQVTYSIIVSNQGTVASNDYCVIDILPAGMSFVSASDNGTFEEGLVNWIDLPNIDPGQTKILTITLRMEDASFDSYRNFAEISNDSAEDYGVNDEDSSPDGDVNNDRVINHNDAIADVVNEDEDDHDFEEVFGNLSIVIDIECPDQITISCNDSTEPADIGQAIATTNCAVDGIEINFEDITAEVGNCSNERTFVRYWTATDVCGGRGACEQIITIVDEEAPILSCAADITVSCDDAVDIDITGISSATDNWSKLTGCADTTRILSGPIVGGIMFAGIAVRTFLTR